MRMGGQGQKPKELVKFFCSVTCSYTFAFQSSWESVYQLQCDSAGADENNIPSLAEQTVNLAQASSSSENISVEVWGIFFPKTQPPLTKLWTEREVQWEGTRRVILFFQTQKETSALSYCCKILIHIILKKQN